MGGGKVTLSTSPPPPPTHTPRLGLKKFYTTQNSKPLEEIENKVNITLVIN